MWGCSECGALRCLVFKCGASIAFPGWAPQKGGLVPKARSLPELSQCRGRSSWGGWTGRTLPWRTGQRLSMCPLDHLSGEPASTVSTATPAGGKRNPASVGGRRSPSLGSLRQGKELSSEAMPGAPARQKFNKYSRQSLLPQPQFRFPQF